MREPTEKQQLAINQLLINPNRRECADVTGFSYSYIRNLVTKPHIKHALEKGTARIAEKATAMAGVDAAWVLQQAVKVHERCMQEVPVLDKEGEPTGEYRFEHAGANKALEIAGKHKDVNAFGPEAGGQLPPVMNWNVTVVHQSKEEYERPAIEGEVAEPAVIVQK